MTFFKTFSTGHYGTVLNKPFTWTCNIISMAWHIYSIFFVFHIPLLFSDLGLRIPETGRKTITHIFKYE